MKSIWPRYFATIGSKWMLAFLAGFLFQAGSCDVAHAQDSAVTNAETSVAESKYRHSVRLELDSAHAVLTSQFLVKTQMQEVKFETPVTGRYFCLETLSAHDGRAYAAVAELELLDPDGDVMDRSGWKIAYADSEEHERENSSAENAIDGDPKTFWHTQWRSAAPGHPHHLIIDLGSSRAIGGFGYLARPGSGGEGGRIKDYRVYVGDNLLENAPEKPLPDKFYLLTYFLGGGDTGLQLGYSLNGYHWDVLNRGEAVMKPEVGGKLMRDPRVTRGPDGTFHLVWTAAWFTNGIGYASSTDLVHWSEQQLLPVMADVPGARNCWAPDIFWDTEQNHFLIIWASTVTNEWDDLNHVVDNRLYSTTTTDFKTFSATKVFYDPGFGVLNGVIVHEKNRFHLIFKDEPMQRLRIATADHADGPYGNPSTIIQNNDSPEGPICYKLGSQNVIFFNLLSQPHGGAVRSTDMEHWEDISAGIVMPPGTQQGSVLELPGKMFEPFLESGLLDIGATPAASELGLGDWIWTTNITDLQVSRFWRAFYIPPEVPVARAELRMTVDNSYTVYLDGRQIGRGGDPNNIAEYDLTWLMSPGRHILAVEAFNDSFDAGMILGLRINLANGKKIEVVSDSNWRIAPGVNRDWLTQKQAYLAWPTAQVVGYAGHAWWQHPNKIIQVPPLQPPVVHFWQQPWVLALLLIACLTVAVLLVRQTLKLALQTRASSLLERERARIARDMHDDLGSGLTQLTLLGELVLRDVPKDGETRTRVHDLCAKARYLLRSMDEIVWTVNPKRDTIKDFVAFISEHAQEFLASTEIRCRQEIADELPDVPLDLPQRRNLLLAIKEALRNAARHSGATEVKLTIRVADHSLKVVIEDNGKGFAAPASQTDRNGLVNMKQRLTDVGGSFILNTAPGKGSRITFVLPLEPGKKLMGINR